MNVKKTFHLMYYILFVAALWGLNRHFQNFVAVNGVLQGLLVGLVLAFLVLLVFKTITRVALFLIVITGVVVFLFSVEFFVLPPYFSELEGVFGWIRALSSTRQ